MMDDVKEPMAGMHDKCVWSLHAIHAFMRSCRSRIMPLPERLPDEYLDGRCFSEEVDYLYQEALLCIV